MTAVQHIRFRTTALALTLLFAALAPTAGAQGQFYNPSIYSRTRQSMSNRAAARAAAKRQRRKHISRRVTPARPRPRLRDKPAY